VNCSTNELARIEGELDMLHARLDAAWKESRAQLGAKVAEIRQMLEQLAEAMADAGDPTRADQLRRMAGRLVEIARREVSSHL
jgi:hypothetical protein